MVCAETAAPSILGQIQHLFGEPGGLAPDSPILVLSESGSEDMQCALADRSWQCDTLDRLACLQGYGCVKDIGVMVGLLTATGDVPIG